MLSFQTLATLVQNMAAAAQSAASTALDFTVGSVLRALMQAVASAVLWLQYLVLAVLQQAFLSSCTGPQVDTWLLNNFPGFLGRLPAIYSTGAVTFARFTSATSAFIPIGALVRTGDGTQSFAVVADVTNPLYSASLVGYTIPAGTASAVILVQAVVAGTGANVAANTISQIVGALPGVDTVNNAAAFTNGEAAESDAAVKTRFQNWLATLSEGTEAAVQYHISLLGSNITSDIVEFTNTAGVYTPGEFVVYADDGTGNPSTNTLNLVSAAVNATRALGVQYAVQGPTLITATVSATITVAAGVVKANIIGSIEQAIAAFIDGLGIGVAMPYSRIGNIIYGANPGVTNVTSILLNSGTVDIGGAAQQVVRAGTITVS